MDKDNKTIRQREEQIKILRNSVVGLAELMLWFARLMANERDELKRTLARKNENVENLRAVGKDAAFRIMTVIDERNEARAIACKLLTERNEAQAQRNEAWHCLAHIRRTVVLTPPPSAVDEVYEADDFRRCGHPRSAIIRNVCKEGEFISSYCGMCEAGVRLVVQEAEE